MAREVYLFWDVCLRTFFGVATAEKWDISFGKRMQIQRQFQVNGFDLESIFTGEGLEEAKRLKWDNWMSAEAAKRPKEPTCCFELQDGYSYADKGCNLGGVQPEPGYKQCLDSIFESPNPTYPGPTRLELQIEPGFPNPKLPAAPKSSIVKSPHIPSIRSGSVNVVVGSAIDPSSSPLSLSLLAAPSSSAGLQGDVIIIVAGRAVQVARHLHRRQCRRRPVIFIAGRLPASDLPFFIIILVDSSQALLDCSALLCLRRPLQASSALSSSSQASLPCLAPMSQALLCFSNFHSSRLYF
ncbi:hypothetical protein ACLOJK_029071 [Asimina triloba]